VPLRFLNKSNRAPPKIIKLQTLRPKLQRQIFSGGYLRWSTFHDLCTAIYIDNPSLTRVEKLLKLSSSGEAHSIVSKSRLINDSFRSASKNKRLQVNSNLKTLFNVQSRAEESGTAPKEF